MKHLNLLHHISPSLPHSQQTLDLSALEYVILTSSLQIEAPKKAKKLTSSEQRKKKKERMARKKRGEEVFSDEDDF